MKAALCDQRRLLGGVIMHLADQATRRCASRAARAAKIISVRLDLPAVNRSRDRVVRRARADHALYRPGRRDPLRQHGLCRCGARA